MTRRRTRAAAIGSGLALALCVSGCGLGSGLYNAPLPGGADLGDHPYSVTIHFGDALDLVPQSGVKVNDVAVGRVTGITLEKSNGKVADVTVELNGGVTLPANAAASIQQSSLLGEKYVALSPPLNSQARGRLRNKAIIPIERTSQGVEVEQVFGALSLLLTGGGIGQLHDIYTELNAFGSGNQNEIRRFLSSVTTVVTTMNSRRSSITSALDALGTLSTALAGKNRQITRLLAGFSPGIAELASQRTQIIGALDALNKLSTVTVQTLDASKRDIVADLNQLAPILRQLAAAGSAFPRSLQLLVTYPFTNAAVAGIKGDYLNAYVTEVLNTKGGTTVQPNDWQTSGATSGSTGTPATIMPPAGLLPATSSAAPGLPGTLSLAPSGSPSASASRSASSSGSAGASGSRTGSSTSGAASSGGGSSSASASSAASGSPSTSGSSAGGGR